MYFEKDTKRVTATFVCLCGVRERRGEGMARGGGEGYW